MQSIVALDIETTGLDAKDDSIIEIGAVRFNDRRVEAEWSTLINPGRRIPPSITELTGITDQMVLQAPYIQDVINDLGNFIGDLPILGHNVNFDVSFFQRYKLFRWNELIDTYEMAAVLLPSASRYNLRALAQELSVPYTLHRALGDAQTTRGIYLRLFDEALQLPILILSEIVRLSDGVDWLGYLPFKNALLTRSNETFDPHPTKFDLPGPLFSNKPKYPDTILTPTAEAVMLDTDEVSSILEPGGEFAHHFPDYEYRSQQIEMLRAITQALSEGKHLLVEAGTGIGKSIAYLIPSVIWAKQNQFRVVISTNTINLQDQLINKDIPDIKTALGWDLNATVLKGRSNYLCPRRLESMRRRGPENPDELRILAKVLVWLQGTTTGDRGEINLNNYAEKLAWSRISSDDMGCTTDNCIKHTGGKCPFYRARQAAHNAHLIIVNHALLLADAASGYHVLPEYDYLIVDEAHHLEDATTNALSFEVTQRDVARLIKELGSPTSGLLGWLLSATQSKLNPSEFAALNHLVQSITDHAFQFDNLSGRFFASVDHFMGEQREGRQVGRYSHQERILAATRIQPAWADVEVVWDETQHSLNQLLDNMNNVIQGLAEINNMLDAEDTELYGSLTNSYRRLKEVNDNLNGLVFDPAPDRVYWTEASADIHKISLHAAPLHIGPLMEHYLWHEKTSVILTSATLTTAGEFDYIKGRLNADDAYELALGSPFDYETATLLYVANDIPEPTDHHGHQRAINTSIIKLCQAIGGRTLVLFTSYLQLRRTDSAIKSILAKDNIFTFAQGDGASPHTLLDNFRNTERAVLLGTRAFWEGIDVPGEALSSLVIVKLPFNVPSDPIIAARSETFDDSFYQYSLPEAILRFRQGFGRLIRTQSDRGIVVVLDRRLLTKSYGQYFIDSLPICTTHVGPHSDIPHLAQQWLNI